MPCVVVVLVFLMAAILGAVAVVATGRGGELGHAEPDRPPVRLPDDRMVQPVDLNRLRLPVAFRGYRMADVDRVLDRLAGELADRDRQIDALGQELLGVQMPPLGAFHEREQAPSRDHESSDPS